MMSRFRKQPPIKTSVLVSFFVTAFFLPAYFLCFAENQGDGTVVSKTVTIQSKGDGGIVIDGRRYAVKKSTTILDALGKGISLCDLPVPCEAVVGYRPTTENQAPVCLKIEVKRLLQGASSMVVADDPG
jgi:hypothetical protein